MRSSRSWMIAGALAGLLVARPQRAADDTDTARHEDATDHAESYEGSGEDASGASGAGAGEPGAGRSESRPESGAVRAGQRDAEELAAGNTGGRG